MWLALNAFFIVWKEWKGGENQDTKFTVYEKLN